MPIRKASETVNKIIKLKIIFSYGNKEQFKREQEHE